MKLSLQHKAVANIPLVPLAAVVGLGFIGYSIAGDLGAGTALLIPLFLQILYVIGSGLRELLPQRWRGTPY